MGAGTGFCMYDVVVYKLFVTIDQLIKNVSPHKFTKRQNKTIGPGNQSYYHKAVK